MKTCENVPWLFPRLDAGVFVVSHSISSFGGVQSIKAIKLVELCRDSWLYSAKWRSSDKIRGRRYLQDHLASRSSLTSAKCCAAATVQRRVLFSHRVIADSCSLFWQSMWNSLGIVHLTKWIISHDYIWLPSAYVLQSGSILSGICTRKGFEFHQGCGTNCWHYSPWFHSRCLSVSRMSRTWKDLVHCN